MDTEEFLIFEKAINCLNQLYGSLIAKNQLAENQKAKFKLVRCNANFVGEKTQK